MNSRRPIQQAHERFYVEQFTNWLNHTYHSDFELIGEPGKCEAIIRSSRTTRWIEITTAFWNSLYAMDLYSDATPKEKHKPMGEGPFIDMDDSFTQNFINVVKKKLEKPSYIELLNDFGPGYLVVPIKHPWFNDVTLNFMKDAWRNTKIDDTGCFRSIYIAFPSMNKTRFYRWHSCKNVK